MSPLSKITNEEDTLLEININDTYKDMWLSSVSITIALSPKISDIQLLSLPAFSIEFDISILNDGARVGLAEKKFFH